MFHLVCSLCALHVRLARWIQDKRTLTLTVTITSPGLVPSFHMEQFSIALWSANVLQKSWLRKLLNQQIHLLLPSKKLQSSQVELTLKVSLIGWVLFAEFYHIICMNPHGFTDPCSITSAVIKNIIKFYLSLVPNSYWNKKYVWRQHLVFVRYSLRSPGELRYCRMYFTHCLSRWVNP